MPYHCVSAFILTKPLRAISFIDSHTALTFTTPFINVTKSVSQ